jgi:hypothetical protein
VSIPCIDRLARVQHGLISRNQARACLIPESTLAGWVTSGRLVVVHPAVYRVVGAPVSHEQRLLAAVLAAGPGGAASHRSAAWLWGMYDHDDTVEISVPRPRLPRLKGVVVHRSRDIEPSHVATRRHVPATNPLLTLLDLGAVLPPWLVEDALDRALVAGLVTILSVEAAYERFARPGRRGGGVLRRILDERALGADRPDGLLEPRMASLLHRHGLPPAAFQHEVRDAEGRFVARVDFAYPDLRLAIEVDGFETHASPEALQRDLDRQNALVGLGWTVLRFTWADVVRRPERVVAVVRHHLGASTPKLRR